MIFLLVLLTCALVALGAAHMGGRGGYDWALAALLAAPWVAGLIMLAVRRAMGIALLQSSAAAYGAFLLFPAFMSLGFLDGSLRSLLMLLFLIGCVLILATATAVQRSTPPDSSSVSMAAAWILPVLLGAAAYGLVQTRTQVAARAEAKQILAKMDLKTGDEAKLLAACLARFSAANGQRYPADAAALEQNCSKELRLSYYKVEYIVPIGAADYSMCLSPIPGASPTPNPGPWILGPWGDLDVSQSHPGGPCAHTTGLSANGTPQAAHQCLLRRQARGSGAAPGFRDIVASGDGCLSFDTPEHIKATETELTTPSGRFLLLAAESGDAYRPRILHCDRRSDLNPPRVWTSRSGFRPAPPDLAKLCAPQQP